MNDTLESMLASFTVKEETFDGRRFIFLNHLHRAEKYCAARIRLLGGFPPCRTAMLKRASTGLKNRTESPTG